MTSAEATILDQVATALQLLAVEQALQRVRMAD
jgi:hypothetical protein